MQIQILIGLVLAAVASIVALRVHSLTRGGAIAATLLGTIVFGLGGWDWAVLLLTFFILSSALTRAFGRTKRGVEDKYEKSGERDQMQVFSNGGIAGVFVILHAFLPAAAWPWIGFAGALAAVTADTWATELGVLDPRRPRLISALGKSVEKGTSGGVSLVGTFASLLGAAVIGALAGWFFGRSIAAILTVIALAGLLGSLIDSLLGATLQAIYFCPLDQKETEKHPLHTCGTPTIHIRGLTWLNNDLVNIACAITGAAAALVLGALAGLI